MLHASDLPEAIWRKSSFSGGEGGCVEIADLPGRIAVRDSKNPQGPALLFHRSVFSVLVAEAARSDRAAR